MVSDVLEQIR